MTDAPAPAARGWLTAFRAATFVFCLLPPVVWLVTLPDSIRHPWLTRPDGLNSQAIAELVIAVILAAPFAFILWGTRRATPSKRALAFGVGVSLPPALLCVAILFGDDWQAVVTGLVLLVPVLGYAGLAIRIYWPMRAPRDRFVLTAILTPAIPAVLMIPLIPYVLHSCCDSEIATSVNSIRSITTAEITYKSTYEKVGYACSLSVLGPPPDNGSVSERNAALVDSLLASGRKSGYAYRIVSCSHDKFQVIAEPLDPASKNRAFCADETGVIRSSRDGSGAHCLASGNGL